MQALADSFINGSIISLILALVVIEAAALSYFRLVLGKGPRIAAWLPALISGSALLVALRFALLGSGWILIALSLTVALAAHFIDLAYRFLLVADHREDN